MEKIALLFYHRHNHDASNVGNETVARAQTAFRLWQMKKVSKIIITVTRDPKYLQARPGDWLRDFLILSGVPHDDIILFPCAPSYTTAGEITAALWYKRNHQGIRFVSVSSWYHIPRIWLSFFYFREETEIAYCWYHASWFQALFNLAKTPFFWIPCFSHSKYLVR